MMLRSLKAVLSASGIVLAACSPALDWREVKAPGTPLVALLPCRVVSQERIVPLAGRPVVLGLQACEAAGRTWGVSHADVQDPTLLHAALDELRAAALGNIGAALPLAPLELQVRGATPHPASGRWQAAGHRPDGRVVQMQVAVFAYGTRVFQATVLGDASSWDDVSPFFLGLRLVS